MLIDVTQVSKNIFEHDSFIKVVNFVKSKPCATSFTNFVIILLQIAFRIVVLYKTNTFHCWHQSYGKLFFMQRFQAITRFLLRSFHNPCSTFMRTCRIVMVKTECWCLIYCATFSVHQQSTSIVYPQAIHILPTLQYILELANSMNGYASCQTYCVRGVYRKRCFKHSPYLFAKTTDYSRMRFGSIAMRF